MTLTRRHFLLGAGAIAATAGGVSLWRAVRPRERYWTRTFRQISAATSESGWSVTKDVRYGEAAHHLLDLYHPDQPIPNAAPILFFHGGGWQYGSKDEHRFVGAFLAANGYWAAVANYQLYPPAVFPAFVEDGAAAVSHLRERFSASPIAMGHSAGAHLAALLNVQPERSGRLQGAICLANPLYEFFPGTAPGWEELDVIFPEASRPQATVLDHLSADDPPMLILVGDRDEYEWGSTARMIDACRSSGVAVSSAVLPGVDHLRILTGLGEGAWENAALKTAILDWLAGHPSRLE
jgi:acetyl esterase/lipase